MSKIVKHTNSTTKPYQPKMVIVRNDDAMLSQQIDQHLKSIKALIKKATPAEKQQYYQGLLNHILTMPYEQDANGNYSIPQIAERKPKDNLNVDDLALIQEMSFKLEELHRLNYM
jgi:hypothetical protein